MDTSTLISAINEVLQAQSEEEIVFAINRYPELSEEETFMQIMAMIEQAKQSGQDENVEALQIAVNRIAFIVQTQTDTTQTEPLPKINPKVVWAIKARRYLALRKTELLNEAITAAQETPEIVEFLKAFQQDDPEKIDQITEHLLSQLPQSNRDEEGYTINLIFLDTRAILVEQYIHYPFDEQRQLRELGIQACQQAAQISGILQDTPCQAFYLAILAMGFYHSRQLHEAESFYFKALEIYQQLAENESHIFRQYVAMTLNDLGNVQGDQRKLTEAEISYNKALKIRRKLAESEPHIFLKDVAMTLNNLGNAQRDQRKLTEAEISYGEALEIHQKLAETEPHIFLPDVAMILNNLGDAQGWQRKLTEAENSFNEALKIYQKLMANEPHIFLPALARTLDNLGNAQRDQRKLTEAENSFSEALELYHKLAKSEPHIFLPALAGTLNNLGTTQYEQRKLRESEISYRKALEIHQKLAETEPHIFRQYTALTLNNLGAAQNDQRKLRESENSFNEALEVYQKLAESEPNLFLKDVAMTLHNLGVAQRDQRKLREAENSFSEALELYHKLTATDPHIFLPALAGTLNNLGTTQYEQRKLRESEISYREALEIYQKLAETEPHIFLKDEAQTLNNLGNAQNRQRKLREAEISYNEALEIIRKLAEREPHIFLKDVALTFSNLGTTQSDQKKLREGENSYREALKIYQKLVASDPHIFLKDVAQTLNNLGSVQIEQGKQSEGENSSKEALEIYRNLAERDPHIFLQNVAMTLSNLGYLQLETNVKKAEKIFAEALGLSEKLREKAIIIDDKTRIMQENINVYDGLLTCYLKMENWPHVLEIAELGKSRSLTDLLNLKSENLQPKSSTPETVAEVKELGQQYSDTIKKLQQLESTERHLSHELYQIDDYKKQIEEDISTGNETKIDLFKQIIEAKQSLLKQQQETQQKRFAAEAELTKILAKIHQYDSNFPPNADSLKPEEIINISKNLKRIIIIFRVLREMSAIIFIFPDGKLHVEEIISFGREELVKLYFDKWLIPYEQSNKNLDIWFKAIEKVLFEVDEKLIFKVREILADKAINETDVKDVLFIPNLMLTLLPLHAASREENGKFHYFLEDYNVSYCPSVSVFKRCLENEPKRTEKTLGIITPSEDLFGFAEGQLNMLQAFNSETAKLSKDEATLENVLEALTGNYGFIHFYCHGEFDEGNPFDSGLIMADGKLNLSQIINTNLKENWLTVLSACETGMVDFQSPTDEHFGLPLGFVFAGSPSVWASLWSVSAVTTSDLMEKAYQNLNKPEFKNNKSAALRQAQIEMSQNENFSHPFYWAGFQHFGV